VNGDITRASLGDGIVGRGLGTDLWSTRLRFQDASPSFCHLDPVVQRAPCRPFARPPPAQPRVVGRADTTGCRGPQLPCGASRPPGRPIPGCPEDPIGSPRSDLAAGCGSGGIKPADRWLPVSPPRSVARRSADHWRDTAVPLLPDGSSSAHLTSLAPTPARSSLDHNTASTVTESKPPSSRRTW
jgi:hypothetical protein